MSLKADDPLRAAAIEWRIRLRDGGAADWEAFVDWLEADPARSEAYDAAAMEDAALGDAIDLSRSAAPANDDGAPPVRSGLRHYSWIGAAAAVLLLAVLIGWPLMQSADEYRIATPPGVQRMIELDGGDRIALNGGSAILLKKGDARFASLERGEALFDIRHDPKRPFELVVGDSHIRDVGTRFDVVRDEGVRVAVAEGSILYNPRREAVLLKAGQALVDAPGDTAIKVSEVQPSAVGGWRIGHLSYRGAPVARVAGDLSRTLGVPVTVDPTLADRRFTGTIHLGGNLPGLFAHVGAVLDVDARPRGKGWELTSASRAAH
ncbi:MAG TPA: FecR domain-containing protein [Sphingomonas sp.]|nr:FecR domain-containing protein [Sphingomonas sp.]